MAQKKTSPSLISSAALEGSALDLRQQELFGQSHSVSVNRSAKLSSESTGPTSRSTTMLEPSTQIDLEELTSSAAGSHASRGPLPGSSEAQKMTAISGRSWLPLLKTYGLDGSLAKMCEALLTSRWASNAAFLTWKASDTKPSHLLFQLAVLMPRIDATASGSSPRKMAPTPTAGDHIERTSTSSEKVNPLTGKSVSLDRFVRFWPDAETQESGKPKMWPTPRSCSAMATESIQNRVNDKFLNLESVVARAMWPTPTTRDYKGANSDEHLAKARGHHDQLPNAVKMAGDKTGSLNPTWVEWLMGFPTGWTDLKPSEMPSSRKSSRKSGAQSSKRRADGRNT